MRFCQAFGKVRNIVICINSFYECLFKIKTMLYPGLHINSHTYPITQNTWNLLGFAEERVHPREERTVSLYGKYKDITWRYQSLTFSVYPSLTLSCQSSPEGAELPPEAGALTLPYSLYSVSLFSVLHTLNQKDATLCKSCKEGNNQDSRVRMLSSA